MANEVQLMCIPSPEQTGAGEADIDMPFLLLII